MFFDIYLELHSYFVNEFLAICVIVSLYMKQNSLKDYADSNIKTAYFGRRFFMLFSIST